MSLDTSLKGKTAVVTGSTSGIGLGVATSLAEAGARVILNGRSARDECLECAEKIRNDTGAEVEFIAADMGDPDACHALVEQAGGCDILVNNAGVQHVAGIAEFPVEKWNLILAVNLSSAFHTTAAALPHMRKRGWGRVVNIASAHGLTASPYKSAYVAAKHGVLGLTRAAAHAFAPE